MDHTFMQCWLPACSWEMIPRTRNERGLSSAGRECWRTKVIHYLSKNLTLDSPCPCWSGPVRWLQRAWWPCHLTPADQSRPPSQIHSLHDNNKKIILMKEKIHVEPSKQPCCSHTHTHTQLSCLANLLLTGVEPTKNTYQQYRHQSPASSVRCSAAVGEAPSRQHWHHATI